MNVVISRYRFIAYTIFATTLSLPAAARAGQALLIAYPESKITVDFLALSKMELGHAGILMISDAGVTRYYEFGRYDQVHEGKVRKVTLPNVSFTSKGEVNKTSLLRVLQQLSNYSGQRGRILAAYIPKVDYNAMNKFVQDSMRDWPAYHWYSNNCATYATAVLKAGSPANSPLFSNIITTPENLVTDYLIHGAGEVKYDPKSKTFCFKAPGPWFLAPFQHGCQSLATMGN
ncbi:MAG: hypothetical protein P1V20_11160 [Verrucomicrobiales bacterium]|nr:hypothetical protein [Verrucomicrobiales bacterium]